MYWYYITECYGSALTLSFSGFFSDIAVTNI